MATKLTVAEQKPLDLKAPLAPVEPVQTPVDAGYFKVKIPLSAPLDFAVAQLYRVWPKPRDRRDN
jgi:hypothetical protein